MLSKRIASLVLSLGTGIILVAAGCGGSSSGPGSLDPLLMYINACQDGPVAFFANDVNVSGTLVYKGKTPFKSLAFIDPAQGGYDVSLEDPNRATVWDSQANVFQKDTSTVLVAFGVKNPDPTEQLKRLRFTQFLPDRTAPIGNRARIIFLHAFNRKTGFQTPKLVLQNTGDQPLFQTPNTDYGTTQAIEIDSGTYKFFGLNDTRNNYLVAKDPDNDQIYGLPPVDLNGNPKPMTFAPGGIYIVMLSGTENGNGKASDLVVIPVQPKLP